MVDTACPDCGAPTTSHWAVRPRLCKECGRQRHLAANRRHKQAHREEIRAASRIVVKRDMTCVDCGDAFVRQGNRGPFPKWCPKCTDQRVSARLGEAGVRRYVATRGRPAERVTRAVVFERDRWVCQLCGMPVFRVFKWPAPWSPSLDHILPLSRGGQHTYANVQLAHLRCNARKYNKGEAAA